MIGRITLDLNTPARDRLKRFKIEKSESYDDELNRVMDKLEEIEFYTAKIFEGNNKKEEK